MVNGQSSGQSVYMGLHIYLIYRTDSKHTHTLLRLHWELVSDWIFSLLYFGRAIARYCTKSAIENCHVNVKDS